MFRRILQALIAFVGVILGYALSDLVLQSGLLNIQNNILLYTYYGLTMIIFGLLLYLVAPRFVKLIESVLEKIEGFLSTHPRENLLIGFIGIIIGVILAFIISFAISGFRPESPILQVFLTIINIILYLSLATLGYRMATKNKDEIIRLFNNKSSRNVDVEKSISRRIENTNISDKLLDTSVLIDGRIQEIAKTGFIDGNLIIPNFVLEELQLIADSQDELKRERGRRGLDLVNELMNNEKIVAKNSDIDFKGIKEVDIKLLKYANEHSASIITNDFNLNKLAIVQGIKVLNINDLANAVKIVVIPGEKMIVKIVKEGREKNQGLAYLDDGTMIVVEDGKDKIGETVEVVVSTVLQTAAGKMIFTKIINS